MPIAERGYTHWTGTFLAHARPWLAIARLGIRTAFRRKFFKFVLSFAFVPSVIFVAGIYISERIQDFQFMVRGRDPSGLLKVNPEFFRTYYTNEFLLFVMVMMLVLAGAGLIADDLKYNSLQLYFSRPLRKRDYIGGKLLTILFFLLLVTLVPGFLFIVFKIIFSGSLSFLGQYPWLILSVVADSLLISLFFAAYTLLISSLSKNRRLVSILLFLVYIFSDVFFGIFFGIFRKPAFCLLSIKVNIQQVGAALFRVAPKYDVPWIYSLLVLAAITASAFFILRRRTRSVEVIK